MKKQYQIPRKYCEVGEFLKNARLAKNFTQSYVARQLGYSSAQFISNFERGIALPPVKKLKMLVKLYALSSTELIDIVNYTERQILASALGEKSENQRMKRASL